MTVHADAQAVVNKLNKELGDGTVLLGSEINYDALPRISSGSLSLDVALGGGWPANQWNEIVGDESHGKTAIIMKTLAANMARDPEWTAVLIDAESSYDKRWARQLGVDTDRLIVVTTNIMEEAFQAMIEFLGTKAVDALMLDSLPALVPSEEGLKLMEDSQVGLGARLTGKFFRKQGPASKRSLTTFERPCTGFIINQWREKIGIIYGDNRTTPGGRHKNFACFTRVECRRDEWLGGQDDRYGLTIKLRVFKNKSAPPLKTATVDFIFEDRDQWRAGQYDEVKDVVATALLFNVVARRGAYYDYGGETWQGKAPMIDQLREDIGLREQIREEVLTIITKQHVVTEAQAEPKKKVRRAVKKK